MPLKEVRLSIIEERLPRAMQTFLQEADLRIEQFIANRRVRISGFVPSDFVTVFHALNSVVDADWQREICFVNGAVVLASLP